VNRRGGIGSSLGPHVGANVISGVCVATVDRGVSAVSVRVGRVEPALGDTEAFGDTRALAVAVCSFSGVGVADCTSDHSRGSGVGEFARLNCRGVVVAGVLASAISTKPIAKRVWVGIILSIGSAQLANNHRRTHQMVAFSSPSSIRNNRLLRRSRSLRASTARDEAGLMT
jgi:hypothetical protein